MALKAQYGPTLVELVAPRWRRASIRSRWIAAIGVAVLAGAILAAVLTLQSATISHGGPVPFSFAYKGLDKAPPESGAYVRVERLAHGRLEDSFSVAPLALPTYGGNVTGEYPLYASAYIRSLAARYERFRLVAEGPVRTSAFGSWEELPPSTIYYHVPTYTIAYTALVQGHAFYGREIWLVPNRRGARAGVDIRMLTAASAHVSPLSVGTSGILSRPMRTFTLGS